MPMSRLQLLIQGIKTKLCIQKQFHIPLLFNNPIGPRKKTLLHVPTLLDYGNFLKSDFFLPPGFYDRQYPILASSGDNFVANDIIL